MGSIILSVIVPCFNSQNYMDKCLDSLLSVGSSALEILIVNDGSTDRTGEIADTYSRKYQGIVRVLHQENKGHGGALNTGLRNASGLYIKVVDSDDWVDTESFAEILKTLKTLEERGTPVDMLVSNYVYEKEGVRCKKVIRYGSVMPRNRVFGWKEVKKFHKGQYMLMHALIYRTTILKESGLELPLHTFYVDNLYAFIPLNFVSSIYYLDMDFYRYYIGREDQSVNEQVMIQRIDQQLKINRLMIEHMLTSSFSNQRMKKYMLHYLEVIMTVSTVLLIRSNARESLEKKQHLWSSVKNKDQGLYYRLRYGMMGFFTNLPGTAGRFLSIFLYKLSQKAIGFN